ncbi:MAG: hypothetical protein AMXMBFR4_12910 [Candidatus Hydrogenedentota bacterium]
MKHSPAGVLVLLCVVLPACQTPQRPAPPPPLAAHTQFEPAWYITTVQHSEGRYPDLFGAGSRAIWVEPEVARIKKEASGSPQTLPEPGIDEDALAVTAAYIVIECQLESQFGDMSIAYDAVRLRGIDVYMEMPDGRKISPIQLRSFGPVEEEAIDALKRFRRTTVAIFPRQDLITRMPVFAADSPSMRLVLAGHDSRFFFEWPSMPAGQTGPRMPTSEEAQYMAKLGYYELFTGIRRLAHIFD